MDKHSDTSDGSPSGKRAEVAARAGWGRPPRETLHQARRYSRFVGVMKRVLPATAAVLGAAVLAYALLPQDVTRMALTFARWGKIQSDLAMVRPRLTGTDERGQPFTVTAATAIQDGKSGHRAKLNKVEADITLRDGTWLNVVSDAGLVDTDARTLELAGNISFYSDNGYEAHAPAAAMDLKTGIVQGVGRVQAQGPLGTLTADRFEIHRDSKKLVFRGNVRTVFYRAREKGK